MKQTNTFFYEFGPYRLDIRERTLLRYGQPVPLTPKAYETLRVLLQNSGHLLERDQLIKEVWPETYVEEANLTQNIFVLRKVLAESGDNSKYIETVPRRGYRFAGNVRRVSSAADVPLVPQVRAPVSDGSGKASYLLAVLPFVNASDDPNMEYLSDGITESIINSLSQLPQLRVVSRSAVFRYKCKEVDPQRIGKELEVEAALVGMVRSHGRRLVISTELVDVANGWQLWGENYDRPLEAILDVQEEIARQISEALRLRLTGDEEERLTRRYTENSDAYDAYLQARHHWGKFSRQGLQEAIAYFNKAMDLDPKYALAYSGIVDCYLRLATNYVPPVEAFSKTTGEQDSQQTNYTIPESAAARIRCEWDVTGVERELRRAAEFKSNYPAAHQWNAAYLFALRLFRNSLTNPDADMQSSMSEDASILAVEYQSRVRLQSVNPTPEEEVQIFCTIAREQIAVGNYEAACALLERWWSFGKWPKLEGSSPYSCADLLFTTGALTGWMASTQQTQRGQKDAEALLNGAIAVFEHLGSKERSAEGRIELGYCYYREGFFDLSRSTLLAALETLSDEDRELRSVGLIRLAIIERHAGRLYDSLSRLEEARQIAELIGPRVTGRYHHELATTLKDLAIAEKRDELFEQALQHYQKALYEFEAIGNHRYAAILENNHGYLLLSLKRIDEAEAHLLRARKLFDGLSDPVHCAQVDETLTQFHLAAGRFCLAEQTIAEAVETLQSGGQEAVLAEALITQGLVFCRLGRLREAKRILNRAHQVAERCGDSEGAGRALLIMIEEMYDQLDNDERRETASRLKCFLGYSQQASTLLRVRKCLDLLCASSAKENTERAGAV